MWTRDGTVLTVSSRAMLAACERLGLDTAALLRTAGVSAATLADPDARLEARQVGALWSAAYAASGDPVLSLHAAEACPMGAYKVIDFMACHAATVGEAFRFASRYFPLINTAVRLPIDEAGDPVTMDIVDESRPEGVTRPYAEYCFAAFALHIREATGMPFRVHDVSFAHPAPPDVSEHARLFGCPVRFAAAHTRIAVARAEWERPGRGGDPGVLQVLTQHADLLLERLPRRPDFIERTRRAIGERLRGGDPSLEGVARVMGTSARTLQRRLEELGFSFQALADEVRDATARLYLEQPDIAIAEVAFLLGFADASTFTRAFKRWTGETPARWRAQAASRRAPPPAGG